MADGITDSMDLSLGELQELVMDREALACCDSWGRKESDMTERLIRSDLKSCKEIKYSYIYDCICMTFKNSKNLWIRNKNSSHFWHNFDWDRAQGEIFSC